MTHHPTLLHFYLYYLFSVFVLGCGLALGDDVDNVVPHKISVKGLDRSKQKSRKSDLTRGGGNLLSGYKEADTNDDGILTIDEFEKIKRLARLEPEKRQRLFWFLDKNKDGKLHHNELHPTASEHFGKALKQFDRLDKDNSGGLSQKELGKALLFAEIPTSQLARSFGKIDRNNNGELEKNELAKHEHHVCPPIHFAQHDRDKSGGLSFEEYSAIPFMNRVPKQRCKKIFDRIDTDKDQQLSPQEIRRVKPPRPPRRNHKGAAIHK